MFNSSNDRTGLCTFIFDDGRHCNMPHTPSELRLCYFHEKRELRRLFAVEAGIKISRLLATNLHTACDLSNTFGMLFRAGVQGHIEPKLLNSLTRLGQLIVQTHLLAKQEYLDTYENDWSSIVLQSVALRPDPDPANPDSPQSQLDPTTPNPESFLDDPTEPAPDTPNSQASVAADLSRRPSPQPPPAPDTDNLASEQNVEDTEKIESVEDVQEIEGGEEAEEIEMASKEGEELQTETTSDPHTDDPTDTGSHRNHRQPNTREQFRYLRYLQRHGNVDQPHSNLTPCGMSRSTKPPVTPCQFNRFSNSPSLVNHRVTTRRTSPTRVPCLERLPTHHKQ